MKATLDGVEAEDSQCRIALVGPGTLYAWGLAENGRLGLVSVTVLLSCNNQLLSTYIRVRVGRHRERGAVSIGLRRRSTEELPVRPGPGGCVNAAL